MSGYLVRMLIIIHPSVQNTTKSAPETLRYQQNQQPWQPCSLELSVRVNELSSWSAKRTNPIFLPPIVVQHFQWVTLKICLNSFRIDFFLVKKFFKFKFCRVQLYSQKPTQITNPKKRKIGIFSTKTPIPKTNYKNPNNTLTRTRSYPTAEDFWRNLRSNLPPKMR